MGWLGMERWEGCVQEGGRPVGDVTPAGVRGVIVAKKRRNGRGAKDARKVDTERP